MKKDLGLMFAFLIIFVFGANTVLAQITITLPNLPKIKKAKQEQQKQEQPKEEPQITTDNNQSNQTTGSKPVAKTDRCLESLWLERHLEETAKRQKEIDDFTPERRWFTKSFTYDHLLHAVSLSAREKWLKDSYALEYKDCANLVSAFDNLATSVAKKLPLFVANPKAYDFRNPAEEKMMKAALENIATLKIHKTGILRFQQYRSFNREKIITRNIKRGENYV